MTRQVGENYLNCRKITNLCEAFDFWCEEIWQKDHVGLWDYLTKHLKFGQGLYGPCWTKFEVMRSK
jgi:hypothetical protein